VAVLQHIVDQHAEEAAFLWLLRDRAVHAPHYALRHLARLDERLEAHLDGLRVAGESGWETARAAMLEHQEPGEIFAAGALALESGRWTRLEEVMAAAAGAPALVRPLVSAFGWTQPEKLRGIIPRLLASPSPLARRVGLAACGVHRGDPGAALEPALRDGDAPTRARALRCAGELGRADLVAEIRARTRDDDPDCAFWAGWSATLLGDRAPTPALTAALNDAAAPHHARALEIVLRSAGLEAAHDALRAMSQDAALRRSLVVGAGIVGDPAYVPWLLDAMADPTLARAAGEAFALITGADLALEDLEGNPPADFAAGPDEDPGNPDVALDPEEHLPWPDPAAVRVWWSARASSLPARTRHFVGAKLTPQSCGRILREGRQRQRSAAALELVLGGMRGPLFETRAPAPRQGALLGCAKAALTAGA
jgi:uncharacterized protein (TIGR02270 family)